MENPLKVKLRDYDHVDQVAHFSFVSESSAAVQSITMHYDTFKKLATPSLASKMSGKDKPSELQASFIAAVKAEIKGDLVKWFEEITNEFMKMKVTSPKA